MLRALVITPDKPARDTIKVGLEQTQKFVVETAVDGWALELAQTNPYDVLVTDTTLADGSDGLELLKSIQAVCPDAQTLLITRSRTQSRYLSRERHTLGIYAFLHLPVDRAEFFKTVARLLDRVGEPSEVAAAEA